MRSRHMLFSPVKICTQDTLFTCNWYSLRTMRYYSTWWKELSLLKVLLSFQVFSVIFYFVQEVSKVFFFLLFPWFFFFFLDVFSFIVLLIFPCYFYNVKHWFCVSLVTVTVFWLMLSFCHLCLLFVTMLYLVCGWSSLFLLISPTNLN